MRPDPCFRKPHEGLTNDNCGLNKKPDVRQRAWRPTGTPGRLTVTELLVYSACSSPPTRPAGRSGSSMPP